MAISNYMDTLQAVFNIIWQGTYKMECSFSSFTTDGVFPPVTDILLDIRLSLLLPCNEKDCRRCLTSGAPSFGGTVGVVIDTTGILI